jgi:hypothetical protein
MQQLSPHLIESAEVSLDLEPLHFLLLLCVRHFPLDETPELSTQQATFSSEISLQDASHEYAAAANPRQHLSDAAVQHHKSLNRVIRNQSNGV